MNLARDIGFPLVVNDVNIDRTTGLPEWGQRPLTLKEFMDIAQRRNGQPTTFVWEEATGYLSGIGAKNAEKERAVNALVRRFHTKHVNLLLFHSLRAVPVWVTDFTDVLILFKTNDRPSIMHSKFRGWDIVLDAWGAVNLHPDPHAFKEIAIFGT